MILLVLSFLTFLLTYALMRGSYGHEDTRLTSFLCALAVTGAATFFWLFVILGFLGIPLSQLGLTLL